MIQTAARQIVEVNLSPRPTAHVRLDNFVGAVARLDFEAGTPAAAIKAEAFKLAAEMNALNLGWIITTDFSETWGAVYVSTSQRDPDREASARFAVEILIAATRRMHHG